MKRVRRIYNGELMSNDSELDQLLYVFERHHDIELEAGLVLAGILIIDLRKLVEEAGTDIAQQMISEIIMQLSKMAEAGQMPEVAQIFWWADGKDRPDEITDDIELMRVWADDKVRIGVRASKDGNFTADSGLLQAAGLMPKSGHA